MFKAARSRLFFLIMIMAVLALGVATVGGTFAFGGNEDPLVNNGRHDVDLLFSRRNDPPVSMFATDAAAFSADLKWYPGKTEIIYLQVDNNETPSLDCTLSLEVGASGFGRMLSYAVIHDLTATSGNHPTSWKDFKAKAHLSGTLEANSSYNLLPQQTLAGNGTTGESRRLALAIHMDESASSAYENAKMQLHFALQVDATFNPGASSAN